MSDRLPLRHYVRWLLFCADIEPLETWISVVAVLWGIWLANPHVNVFATSPGFASMQFVAPQWVWGVLVGGVGVVQILARFAEHNTIRKWTALSQAALWTAVGLALAWQNWRFLSTVTYSALTVGSMWVAYRANDDWRLLR